MVAQVTNAAASLRKSTQKDLAGSPERPSALFFAASFVACVRVPLSRY
jgi:hypothetical protein